MSEIGKEQPDSETLAIDMKGIAGELDSMSGGLERIFGQRRQEITLTEEETDLHVQRLHSGCVAARRTVCARVFASVQSASVAPRNAARHG